jgi:hypothetical protein
MNAQTYMAEDTVIQRGIEALMNALGPIETAHFLNLPNRRILDYVAWHRQWQENLDMALFLDEVFGQEMTRAGNNTDTPQ